MAQNVSLQGIRSQALARVESKPVEKESQVRYYPTDVRFFPNAKSTVGRAPVHEDFSAFMASSAQQIHGNISDSTKLTAKVQQYRFGPEDGIASKTAESSKVKADGKTFAPQNADKNIQTLVPTVPRLIEILHATPLVQPARQQTVNDKGYGPKVMNDPLISMANVSDLNKFSIGLVGGVAGQFSHGHEKEDHRDLNHPGQKIKTAIKPEVSSRSEQAALLRREEVEVMREVKDKFLQQLKAQYPHISMPIKHPEGIVDVHMRFDRKQGEDGNKGSVRVMFTGSNPEVVKLFAQHRDEFIKTITNQGYTIDPSRMQFNTNSSTQV